MYTFINEGVTRGDGNTDISMFFTRSRTSDVLKIVDNHKGPVLYFVFSDIDLEAKPFTDDPEAELLSNDFSTRMHDYGLSYGSFKTLKNTFPQVRWRDI